MDNGHGPTDAARLAAIVDGIAEGVCCLDGTGKIVYMNRAARASLAPAGGDPTGGHYGVLAAGDPYFAEKIRLGLEAGEAARFETYDAAARRWLEVDVSPADNGLALFCRAVNARQRPKEKLSTAFYANAHGMALLNWPAGQYVDVNEVWMKATGIARAEAVGRTSDELGLWVAEGMRETIRERLLADGCVRDLETRVRTKKGDILTVLISIEFVKISGETHLMATTLDITERKRSEELTREQLDLLEDFSGVLAGTTTLIVDEEGTILRFFGDPDMFPENPEGKNLRAALPPPAAADLFAMMAAALAGNGPQTTEFKAGVGDTVKVIEVTAAAMLRRYRDKRTITLHVRDLTAEKAAADRSAQAAQIFSRSTFFHNLLTGGHSGAQIAGELENYGVDTHTDYCCYALQVTRHEPQRETWPTGELVAPQAADEDDIVVWLARTQPGWVWTSNGYIAMLVPADKAGRVKEAQVGFAAALGRELEARFAFTRVKIGAVAEGAPLDLKDLYGKAVEALRLCAASDGTVVHHADTGLYQVAFQLLKDKNMLQAVGKTIGSLAAYDRAHENNLVTTLERIIEDENLRVVAAKLYIHHNTAIWRKKRIEKILGLSLDSFETRALVSLYLKVWKLTGHS